MKKFLLAFAIIFVVNLSCKKEALLCGCSPVEAPSIYLSIKDATGKDLLNTANTGAFAQNDIQLFTLDANGNTKPVSFLIRPPFSYGNNKFEEYSIYSQQLFAMAQTSNTVFYLKTGNRSSVELAFTIDQTTKKIEKLTVDKKEASRENGALASYLPALFYLTL